MTNHIWQEEALECVRNYPGQMFMTEDVRQWAHDQGLDYPSHSRAWGAVILEAKKIGLIVQRGFACVKNPKANHTPASVWAKAGLKTTKAVKVKNDPRQGRLF